MKKELISLQLAYFEDSYEQNLKNIEKLIIEAPKGAIITAPELCLTNFSFSQMEKAANFGKTALKRVQELSKDKVICFTLTEENNGKFYNCLKIVANGKIIHSQPKIELFKLGDEDIYFQKGDEKDIKIIEHKGIKFGAMICFELRFIRFWERLKGADIILIPALWGKLRKENLETLSRALAVANQCFVVVANSSNDDMASSSAIITPFGKMIKDDRKKTLKLNADLREIKKMRRYLDVGLPI